LKRAFTLAEVLVSVFLFGTVMAMVLGILFPSLFMFKAESARSDAQQSAMLLTTRLQRALLNSATEWVTLASDPMAVSYREVNPNSPYDPGSGAARWQPSFQIVRYDAARRKVYEKAWPPAPPSTSDSSLQQNYDFSHPTLSKLTIADLVLICQHPYDKERTLADHVESFIVTDQDGDITMLQPPLKISAVCSVANNGQGRQTVERYRLDVSVTPRCQRW